MASNVRCIFFLLLAISFCLQTHARDSKFFSKVTKENKESISISPTQAPTLAPSPSPEPEVVEHGYGLYGQETYQNYEYPPTTTNPTKSEKFGEEKFVPAAELSKNNFKEFRMRYSNDNFNGNGNGNEKQGMSDTRFFENGKYYYDVDQEVKDERNENGYVSEKQGMSDTRFLENGKYFHDINEGKNGHFNINNHENEKFEALDEEEKYGHFNTNNYEKENENENENKKFEEDKQRMSDTRILENGNGYVSEKQGMSDTRFLENGEYFHDINKEGKNGYFNTNNYENVKFEAVDEEGKYGHFSTNKSNNYDNDNDNEKFEAEKQGMSDTRFLENGKYFYDAKNDHGVRDVGFHNNNNVEYANTYRGNGNGNDEYETEGREGYNKHHGNEYHVKEGRESYNGGNTNKFPNEYDTMEEYDREQGYIDGHEDEYVP